MKNKDLYNKIISGVGITATTDKKYRTLGKDAVISIIKDDISKFEDFYWGIFSDKVNHYYEKFGGIRIPNEYAKEFAPNLLPVENDEYLVSMTLRDGVCENKIIYGFNSKETFDKIISMEDDRINQQILKLKSYIKGNSPIKESKVSLYPEYDEPRYNVEIINMFYDEMLNGRTDLTEMMVKHINGSKDYLQKYVETHELNNKDKRYYTLAIENAKDILDCSTLIEIHKL